MVQLSNLHSELTTDACAKIFSIVAYNSNKTRKRTTKSSSMDSDERRGEEFRQKDLASNEISTSRSNFISLVYIALAGWMVVFGGLFFVCCVYWSNIVPEWAFRLCLAIGPEKECRRICGRELGLMQRLERSLCGLLDKMF